ncbi:hypothetical protein [Nocardia sp. bgisy134]|uniref:hypothetical protein n=1 Tax=Nocardia sp. bgisy134 TaxID=3413789 RepID=UPI003D72A7DB
MKDDLPTAFGRLHAFAQTLSGLMKEAQEAGAEQATGRDNTDCVTVTIDRSGALLSIDVSDNWAQKLDPKDIGPAVLRAVQDARVRQLESSMDSVAESGLLAKIESLNIEDMTPTDIEPPRPLRGPTVAPGQLVDEILQAIESGGTQARPATFVGTEDVDDDIAARVELDSTGIIDCSVGIAWGKSVGGSTIAWAVRQAYDKAYEDVLASAARGTGPQGGLFSEALQVINSLQTPRGQ